MLIVLVLFIVFNSAAFSVECCGSSCRCSQCCCSLLVTSHGWLHLEGWRHVRAPGSGDMSPTQPQGARNRHGWLEGGGWRPLLLSPPAMVLLPSGGRRLWCLLKVATAWADVPGPRATSACRLLVWGDMAEPPDPFRSIGGSRGPFPTTAEGADAIWEAPWLGHHPCASGWGCRPARRPVLTFLLVRAVASVHDASQVVVWKSFKNNNKSWSEPEGKLSPAAGGLAAAFPGWGGDKIT